MNLFQWIALSLLGLLFLLDLRRLLSRPGLRVDRVVRCLTWLAAGVAIYDPELTAVVASALGIASGAHLVLYVFVLAFLGVTFHLYARSVRLERQVTELARHIAILEVRRPPAPAEPEGQRQQREPVAF